jgi:hypothetical protein
MKSTNRLNIATLETAKAERADRSDSDESGFNIVIELDQSEISQVAGGCCVQYRE